MKSEARSETRPDWDDARKSELFAQIVNGELSIAGACQRYALNADTLQEWLRMFRRSALLAFDERLKQTLIGQGASAAALTAAQFTGTLDDISIPDLIQTIEVAAKDAVITVTRDGSESRIWCSAGAIIDAESAPLTGEVALYRILGFERGRMVADFRSGPRVRSIYSSTHRLLLEAARRKDESVMLQAKLGDEQRCYHLNADTRSTTISLSPAELGVVQCFKGARSLREVMATSEHGDFETLTALARLIDKSLLVPTGLSEQPSGARETTAKMTSIASFLPLAATRAPEDPAPSRWVWASLGALAGIVLVPTAFWLGAKLSNTYAPAAAAPPAALAALEPAPPLPSSYSVTARVEPSTADIVLDGHKVGTGRFSIELPKNGTTHELRVLADGFVPALLLFLDAAPPGEIRLERLPSPASAEADVSLAPRPARGFGKEVSAALVGRAPAAVTRADRPRPAAPAKPPVTSTPEGAEASKKTVPDVQIIDTDPPKIQVIE